MTHMNDDLRMERRKQAALHRLGSNHPVCLLCGEDDWRCLEPHHLGGKAYDGLTGNLCRNCHRRLSDPSQNQPAPDDPPIIERIGHLLMGLAQFLLALASRLQSYGQQLLAGAQVCPAPYGWQPPITAEGA